MNVALRRRDAYTSDEFRDAIERLDPDTYYGSSYYERWLAAITTLLLDKGLVPPEAVEETAGG
jgi:nitrile hydratase